MILRNVLYRVADWGSKYENNRTRELKKLDWFPMPNKQDGDGYTLIMSKPNGAAIYGAWVACVQIASRCDIPAGKCGATAGGRDVPAGRGVLLRDGGKPHDSASLSRMSRIPEDTIIEMLELLSSPDVSWLEIIALDEIPHNPAPGCEIPASGCLEGKGIEEKGIEGKEEKGKPPAEVAFEQFWAEYPKKIAKPEALKKFKVAFKKVGGDVSVLLRAIREQKQSEQWTKDGGGFIPHPATWLNQERWADAAPEASPSEPTAGGAGSETPTLKMLGLTFSAEKGPERSQFRSDSIFEAAKTSWQRWKGRL